MRSSLEIAQEASLKPIQQIAQSLGLHPDDLEQFGKYMAKIALSPEREKEIHKRPRGKYILVTATSPTPAGEGKTTTSIGLTQGLAYLGKKAIVTLRQPSLGPVFGVKGGAAGAGYSQVLPMEEINLGFTGDFSRVESAHNLAAAMLDNHIYRRKKPLFNVSSIQFRRAMDMNDRSLREIVIGLGQENGVSRATGFDITAASEIMAILALASDLQDLKMRMGEVVLGRDSDGKPIRIKDIKAEGAMATIMKQAIKPNLVQTYEGQPCIMHAGPFGNIAHGCSSIVGDKLALHLADYVVTEAGFGSDLGGEKFFDIKCRQSGLFPNAAVLVTTVKALKMHGGEPYDKENLKKENVAAMVRGFANLKKHLENIQAFGVPVVVALNKFPTDTEAEIQELEGFVKTSGAYGFAVSDGVADGGKGVAGLARLVDAAATANPNPKPQFMYDLEESIEEKMRKISQKVYGADDIVLGTGVKKKIKQLEEDGFGHLPICMAKTHLSLSDDPSKLGAPQGFNITISDIKISAGAGFIYPLVGKMMTMPGLGAIPAAESIDIDADGKVVGLF
ncbi:formate--tetrahydrofolate ligase [Cytophagales bacterium LB-30]|uniref:Formate--tetrahydrofolate ligase n=1 Tax=Shiella aurantiaca TaxID=3058365 RepID=A0ABT8F6L0_9BACT|nr:formate--tetrahydrofolate ligase [Shiella aurantiaca]MDN4166095.1 formate--tetrahydrofolate ligase [Shiella aurantiaca]